MDNVTIRTCPPALHREALELVLGAISPEQRSSVIATLRPVAERGIDAFAGLAVAEKRGRVVGAAWLQPQAGRTATLWPSVVTGNADSALAKALVEEALSASETLSTVLAQTLLTSPDDPFGDVLLSVGFRHLADLRYLMHTVPKQAPVPASSPLVMTSPALAQRELFERLIQQSYQATLDCPDLEGYRDIADVVEGYQTVGQYDPELWFIAHWHGQPAGVLLLSPYPESNQWELVYMGVVPEQRGNRIGEHILARVRYLASRAGTEHVVLAVDAANDPALRMYDAAGYVDWAQRTAYIKRMETKRGD